MKSVAIGKVFVYVYFALYINPDMKHILRSILSIILFTGGNFLAYSQEIATLEIEVKDNNFPYDIPVSTDLNSITFLADSLLELVEVLNGENQSINFQIETRADRTLIWLLEPGSASAKRTYKLIQKKSSFAEPHLTAKIEDGDGGVILGTANRPLLRYNFETVFPPEGVNELYKRSGFIHPFWTPAGKELTRIQPPDHYHHYGLWNPWTRVEFKGEVYDLWNIADNQGTVRFANFISRENGTVYTEFKALHEHVVHEKEGKEVVLNEVQGVRIFQQEKNEEAYIADISIMLNCATDNEVILKKYRYGGLGWRATEKWHKGNSETITSEGKNRVEADGSLARWCILQGELDEGYGAVLMMSYPTNYNHPEPLRIWPEDMYDRGDVFANFSPTKDKDWQLEPGKTYHLNYRFFVSDQKIAPEDAEKLWQHYAHPPQVKVMAQ